jgi:hypothetical protein
VPKRSNARECYRRAAEAHDIANNTTDPITKADFLQLERRWRSLAQTYESAAPVDEAPSANRVGKAEAKNGR